MSGGKSHFRGKKLFILFTYIIVQNYPPKLLTLPRTPCFLTESCSFIILSGSEQVPTKSVATSDSSNIYIEGTFFRAVDKYFLDLWSIPIIKHTHVANVLQTFRFLEPQKGWWIWLAIKEIKSYLKNSLRSNNIRHFFGHMDLATALFYRFITSMFWFFFCLADEDKSRINYWIQLTLLYHEWNNRVLRHL